MASVVSNSVPYRKFARKHTDRRRRGFRRHPQFERSGLQRQAIVAAVAGLHDDGTRTSGNTHPAKRAARAVVSAAHGTRYHVSQTSGHVGLQLDSFAKSVSAGSAWAAGAVGRTAGDLRRAVGSSMAEAAGGVAEAVGSASHAAGCASRAFGRAVSTPVHLARVRLSKREVRARPNGPNGTARSSVCCVTLRWRAGTPYVYTYHCAVWAADQQLPVPGDRVVQLAVRRRTGVML